MKFKTISKMLIACIITLVGVSNVFAADITTDSLTTALKKDITKAQEALKLFETETTDKLTANITSTTDKITIVTKIGEKEYTDIFNFENGIITSIDETNIEKEIEKKFINGMWSALLLENIYVQKGYQQGIASVFVNALEIDDLTLEKDGIEVKDISETDDIIKTQTKFDISKLAIPESAETPVITISDVKDNTLKITTKLKNATENQMCAIFRSKGNEVAKYLMSVNCSGNGITISDEVEPNTTYLYAAIVEGYSNPGETVKITTKAKEETKPTKTEEAKTTELKEEKKETAKQTSNTVENPKTGIKASYIIAAATIVGAAGLIFVANKKNLFKKI